MHWVTSLAEESRNYAQKSIQPAARLIKYMKEKSELARRRQELELRGNELKSKKGISNKEQKEIGLISEELHKVETRLRSLKNDKTDLLDDIIFPSMANLTFFFEAIAQSPELQETFGSDIPQLFGIRRNNPNHDNYAFMFSRLMRSMCFTRGTSSDSDFSFKLVHELQEIIYYKLQQAMNEIFQHPNMAYYVLGDIGRAKAWTEMIAERVNDEYKFEIQSSKQFGDTEEERVKVFNERAIKNRPSRTFDFDTSRTLGLNPQPLN